MVSAILVLIVATFCLGSCLMFLVCSYYFGKEIKEHQKYWEKVYDEVNNNWKTFHAKELDKWSKDTKRLIQMAANEAATERDRVWMGKDKKKKLESN